MRGSQPFNIQNFKLRINRKIDGEEHERDKVAESACVHSTIKFKIQH